MQRNPLIAFCVGIFLLAGCAGDGPPVITHYQISTSPLAREHVYYTEVKTSSGSTIGAIHHVDANGESTLLHGTADKAFWKDFTLALVGLGGQVGAAAVYGVSIKAAKTAISNTVTTTANPTNTNTNSGPCNESGGGDLTEC